MRAIRVEDYLALHPDWTLAFTHMPCMVSVDPSPGPFMACMIKIMFIMTATNKHKKLCVISDNSEEGWFTMTDMISREDQDEQRSRAVPTT